LQQRFATIGSTLFQQTWKVLVTPSGRQCWAHTASAHRTSDSACTSWQTPTQSDIRGPCKRHPERKDGGQPNLTYEARLASWPTPNAGPQNDTDTNWQQRREECKERHGNNGFGLTLGMAATLASWPTPMAGTPAQKGYNEAGNTDSSRKTVALIPSGWTTPQAHDSSPRGAGQKAKHGTKHGCADLNADAAKAAWSTPRANKWGFPDAHGSHEAPMASWATPKSTDGKGDTYQKQPDDRRVELRHQASGQPATGSPASTEKRGQLNPAHSRWLMGLPPAWDACAPTATRSTRKRQQPSSKPISAADLW
jgi:hypothetical protein